LPFDTSGSTHEVLQQAIGTDAGRQRFDVGLGVRHLPHVLGRLLPLVEWHKEFSAGHGLRFLGHLHSPSRCRRSAQTSR
jgi:hypothetical protein